MKLNIVAGTPGAGKTAVMLHCLRLLLKEEIYPAVVKIDCLNTDDHLRFGKIGVPVLLGLSKDMCPDHYSIYNTDEMICFALENNRDLLIVETAGLCHRCAPYTTNCLGICVIDATAGPNNPTKVGPFLACADIVAVTKGDMISQAEREIFRERILETNPGCKIIEVNGLSGQGCAEVVKAIKANNKHVLNNEQLRHNAPFSVCTLCAGEKRTGSRHHRGLLRNMEGMQEYHGE
jgi:Ni2+-binding GTPase involved in maturation of urease and hydrogenase